MLAEIGGHVRHVLAIEDHLRRPPHRTGRGPVIEPQHARPEGVSQDKGAAWRTIGNHAGQHGQAVDCQERQHVNVRRPGRLRIVAFHAISADEGGIATYVSTVRPDTSAVASWTIFLSHDLFWLRGGIRRPHHFEHVDAGRSARRRERPVGRDRNRNRAERRRPLRLPQHQDGGFRSQLMRVDDAAADHAGRPGYRRPSAGRPALPLRKAQKTTASGR